jgi:hypothetical protein
MKGLGAIWGFPWGQFMSPYFPIPTLKALRKLQLDMTLPSPVNEKDPANNS